MELRAERLFFHAINFLKKIKKKVLTFIIRRLIIKATTNNYNQTGGTIK